MGMKARANVATFFKYFVLIFMGFIMVYPLLWMVGSTFKTNAEIFTSLSPFTAHPTLDGYYNAVTKTYGGDITIWRAFLNTYSYVIPKVVFTVISSVIAAYGFSRFKFKGRDFLFGVMIMTLFLPQVVLNVPQYMMYNKFNWINTYMPFYAPALLCCNAFFPYMLIQFLRGLPRDLDESAYIDGCGTFKTFTHILLPLMKPSLFSAGLFQFLWTYNDYFNSLVFINSVKKFPISLALRMSLDAESVVQWGKVMAMAFVAVVPVILLFFAAQRYFVEGMAGAVKS